MATKNLSPKFRIVCKLFLLMLYFLVLFLALFEVTLFDFTGKGFNNEVFFHFELESVRIAFHQYPVELFGFFLLLVFYIAIINFLLKRSHYAFKTPQIILTLILCLLATNFSAAGRFTKAFYQYLNTEQVIIDQEIVNQLKNLNIINDSNLTSKFNLLSETGEQPKNLILLYLESFNLGLINNEQYPGLTSNLERLSQQLQPLKHLSAAYVTIEGVISSQCGTMLPMTAGNNTFLNNGQLMSNMPCLGDVLKKAGYTQYYLGGAAMEFAGKGKFFEEHGYDHIRGSEYWYANGFKSKQGVWGLSDTQLFANAIDTIEQAANKPPYNVTLLTLGTHLPGYVYEGCTDYPLSNEIFIDAIHCTDQLVGQFVDQLMKKKLLDDTVLMIVADHGVFPTPKMKELFGDLTKDRRLIALTNYPVQTADFSMSSYDMAPTLLDMLDIQHNANFLYGRSLLKKTANNQHFVTRYLDWQGEKMVGNTKEPCTKGQAMTWPLSTCHKHQLLAFTSQLLNLYSHQDTPEPLACNLAVSAYNETLENGKIHWFLNINGNNHFEHFYHDGYLLNSLKINSGTFVFELNQDLAIIKHSFFKNDEASQQRLNELLKRSPAPMLIIELKNLPHSKNNSAELQVSFFKNKQQQWLIKSNEATSAEVNICQ